jgi:hypothetical protein
MKQKHQQKNEVVIEKKKTFFLKQWWNTYIKRLNKATGGNKPQCCK